VAKSRGISELAGEAGSDDDQMEDDGVAEERDDSADLEPGEEQQSLKELQEKLQHAEASLEHAKTQGNFTCRPNFD